MISKLNNRLIQQALRFGSVPEQYVLRAYQLRCAGYPANWFEVFAAGFNRSSPRHLVGLRHRYIVLRRATVDHLGLYQTLAEPRDRRRIGHRAIESKPQEPPEQQPDFDLELSGIARQRIERLHHQDKNISTRSNGVLPTLLRGTCRY